MDVVAAVRAVVEAIPTGCVAAYGEVGQAVGIGPRQAGRAVALLDADVPWWRVVYADGEPATCHDGEARALLEAEGVPFRGGRVDMSRAPLPHLARLAGMSPSSRSLSDLASTLLALHCPGDPVVLPTVWDVWSAQVAVDAGFAALTVGSHPLADSIGRPDGEGMSFTEVIAQVARITEAVDVPVSLDAEAGYGLDPAALIGGLLEVGVVGLNVEDTVHSEGGRLRSGEEHAAYVAGLRVAADAAGVDMVINARTDWFKGKHGDEATRVDDAIARMRLSAEAGASCLYPVGFHDEETLTRLCSELPLPVNALARPDLDDLEMYRRAGAGRITFGPTWQQALTKMSQEWLARWH